MSHLTKIVREKLTQTLLSKQFNHFLFQLRFAELREAFKAGDGAEEIAEALAEMLLPEDEDDRKEAVPG